MDPGDLENRSVDYRDLIDRLNRPASRFTGDQRKRMADIVNALVGGTEFARVVGTMVPDDFSEVDYGSMILQNSTVSDGRDTLLNAFSSTAKDRRSDQVSFFHFLKYTHALSSLREKALQLTAMKYFESNDHAEYSEFLRRCGYAKNGIDGDKRRLFVLCLTHRSDVQRFWSEYADNDSGVCLRVRLSRLEPGMSEYWDLRDVVYDDGSRFSFLKEIRDEFQREFARELFIDGVDKFARFYKRHTYSWETETRVTFDYRLHEHFESAFPVQETKDSQDRVIREFISVPFENQFYVLSLEQVICGTKVSDQQMDDLRIVAGLPDDQVKRRVT